MGSFKRSIGINAPVASVWEVLADIGSIADWNPGVVRLYVTGDRAGEVGAARHCDLGGKNYLDEEVVEWDEGRFRGGSCRSRSSMAASCVPGGDFRR